jgi:hypothetical protein
MMSGVDSRYILEVLKFEYNRRLTETLREAEIFDAQGNIIIKPDLKVRHKKSGYEYTVDRVEGDTPGNVRVILREPDEPRFDPPPEGEELLGSPSDGVLAEDDVTIQGNGVEVVVPGVAPVAVPEEETVDDEYFIVNEEDFEEEYEVN